MVVLLKEKIASLSLSLSLSLCMSVCVDREQMQCPYRNPLSLSLSLSLSIISTDVFHIMHIIFPTYKHKYLCGKLFSGSLIRTYMVRLQN